MSWLIENSLKRVFNVFKRSKDKIYKEDIEALKLLNNELILRQKTYVNDNLLYAKLLCYVINQNLHQNGDIKTALKQSSDILKEPLNYHLQLLHRNINNKAAENYLLSIGIDLNHFNLDYNDNEKIIEQKQKDILEQIRKQYSYENIEKSFYNSANDFLRETENYI